MACFEPLFFASKGRPITINGKTLTLLDKFLVESKEQIVLRFISQKAIFQQGVLLESDRTLLVNGTKAKSLALWMNTAPPEVPVRILKTPANIYVRNIWKTLDGVVHSMHNGAAMIVSETQSGRHYSCNDGEPDDDFDDLVFVIEV